MEESKSGWCEMKITFLGTAGGRFVIIDQIRASGGWILEMDGEMLHIDPGPGALVRAKQYGIDLKKLTGVLVSHAHPDHYTDAEVVLEAMTAGATKKRGILIGNEHAINGGSAYRPAFSPYHLKAVERHEILEPRKETNIGRIKVTATKTSHGEDKGIGFVFSGSRKIGYPSDGEYFPGQEEPFRGCDYLILNVTRPRDNPWQGHMDSSQACELIRRASPKKAIIQHFGMLMLRGVAEREAEWIERETGTETMVARDGMRVETGTEGGLDRFLSG